MRNFALLGLFLFACTAHPTEPIGAAGPLSLALFSGTPLPDFAPGQTYLDLPGGLYENGANTPSQALLDARALSADSVQPVNGRIVVMSLGFSSTGQEWAAFSTSVGTYWKKNAFTWDSLLLVNGTQRGLGTIDALADSLSRTYDKVDIVLSKAGLSPLDVQVIWMEAALRTIAKKSRPTPSLPSVDADAWKIAAYCDQAMTAIHARYPNVRQVFLSNRIYAGYPVVKNSEPYAYESGFGIRQCILGRQGRTDPFVDWGPYYWDPTWPRSDFESDGIHPAPSAEAKVSAELETFFQSQPWFP